jgi:hypothetical protein
MATRSPSGASHPGKVYASAFSRIVERDAISVGYLRGFKA